MVKESWMVWEACNRREATTDTVTREEWILRSDTSFCWKSAAATSGSLSVVTAMVPVTVSIATAGVSAWTTALLSSTWSSDLAIATTSTSHTPLYQEHSLTHSASALPLQPCTLAASVAAPACPAATASASAWRLGSGRHSSPTRRHPGRQVSPELAWHSRGAAYILAASVSLQDPKTSSRVISSGLHWSEASSHLHLPAGQSSLLAS
mmetsp:Transcript_62207/g.166600  ORF Transcript_62207/g.166600 Transcript_62207/m.166600 type:complete len:208 (-) Transcript_62207:1139-1762(-)